jgi:hypothetical protein
MIYQVTPAQLATIESKAQQELGFAISGDEGTASKNGITIQWVYDSADGTLTVGDTKKPWYVPEAAIENELTKLVESVVPAQGGTA